MIVHSLCIAISGSCIVQWGPVELVQVGEGGAISHQGENTLVLGRGSGVVEGRATILVTSVDVGESDHVQNHINTLNVTAVKNAEERAVCKDECAHLGNQTTTCTGMHHLDV